MPEFGPAPEPTPEESRFSSPFPEQDIYPDKPLEPVDSLGLRGQILGRLQSILHGHRDAQELPETPELRDGRSITLRHQGNDALFASCNLDQYESIHAQTGLAADGMPQMLLEATRPPQGEQQIVDNIWIDDESELLMGVSLDTFSGKGDPKPITTGEAMLAQDILKALEQSQATDQAA